MTELSEAAKEAAARATGLRPDQVGRAVEEYRRAADALHDEPNWRAFMHMSLGDGGGIGQYIDPEEKTKVTLQIETGKRDAGQAKVFVLDGKPFETYGEARAAELLAVAKPKPYGLQR